MASPQSERLAITAPTTPRLTTTTTTTTTKALSITPGSRVLKTPLTDEAIWKRLKEAGFDEESIKRRDKAALIAYIAKLEAEIFDHQHHMGLLLLERKELTSKYEQIKASEETNEIMHKRDQALHLSALSEAKKREERLKKAIGVKDECIASLEKALREMRAESAEIKVSAESKLADGRIMVEDAQKKFTEAEAKLHSAESLQAEATRYHRAAERKLQEVEAREDELRRRLRSFKSDMSFRCETSNREGGEESSIILQAMQQQFERMNVVFNEIRDRMDSQDTVIATLREERPQRGPNARRQERHSRMNDSDDYHEDEFEDEEDQSSLNNEGRFVPRRERRGRGFRRDPRWQDGTDRNLGNI
ncbi:protein CROWDED NUCLEI 4-like [Castanea sativa]|uniref:protein CROWDED NUCLEI 4-like n=1 Tax=Castanea sativa TaxID=21020 RepID=UPI003F64C2BC